MQSFGRECVPDFCVSFPCLQDTLKRRSIPRTSARNARTSAFLHSGVGGNGRRMEVVIIAIAWTNMVKCFASFFRFGERFNVSTRKL